VPIKRGKEFEDRRGGEKVLIEESEK